MPIGSLPPENLEVCVCFFQKSTSSAPQSAAEKHAWEALDKLLVDKHDKCLDKLEELGVAEGDMDDESSEGQIWQMIEGRLPYTLDMVQFIDYIFQLLASCLLSDSFRFVGYYI